MKTEHHARGRQLLRGRPFEKGRSGNPAGKPKGAKNKITVEIIRALTASGLTPVEFMTAVYRDDSQPMELRLEAASRVAPYVHPKILFRIDEGSAGNDLRQPQTLLDLTATKASAR